MVVIGVGFLAGVLVAMPPVGPITVLFYRRLVLRQLAPAIALAVVAALSDVLYSGVVTFGYHDVVEAYPKVAQAVRVLGVVVLVGMGIRYALFPPDVREALDGGDDDGADARRVGKELGRGGLIAFLNPSAFVTWTIVLELARTTVQTGPLEDWQRWVFPLAVGVGVFAWFGLVAALWRSWIDRPPVKWAVRVMRIVGVVLIATGLWYAWEASQG